MHLFPLQRLLQSIFNIVYPESRLPVFERPHQEAQKETPSYTLHYIITLDEIRLYCTVLHDST